MSAAKTKFAARIATTLRINSTDAERKLWSRLRDHRLLGFKFVRQCPIGFLVADFACRESDLIIELDGGQHGHETTMQADTDRTIALRSHGSDVLRFWNNDVLTNLDGVLEVIATRLEKAPSPGLRFAKSDLSPKGEAGATRPGEG